MKKLKLALDRLSVDSFRTQPHVPVEAGTIEARNADCTSPATCNCPTSLYNCGTIAATVYSCPQTFDCF
jgi:hypothetical protein